MKKNNIKIASFFLVAIAGAILSTTGLSYAKNKNVNSNTLLYKQEKNQLNDLMTLKDNKKETKPEINLLPAKFLPINYNNQKHYFTKENLDEITPHQALQYLKDGNFRFVNNYKVNRNLIQQVEATKSGQNPFAVTVSCMDSRTSVEHIFDQGIGDIFSIRNAGNVINNDVLGSLEYACKVAGSKLILVLGHSHCGAIKGACKHYELGHLTGLLHKIHPAMEKVEKDNLDDDNDHEDYVNKVGHENVIHSIDEILRRSPILKELVEQGKLGITGGFYNIKTGEVDFFDEIIYNSPKS